MKLHLSKVQLDAVSKYLADISKLIFAGTVLGFFVPIGPQPITISVFIIGIVLTAVSFFFSITLAK